MLKLVSTQKEGVSYPLMVDTKYTIGRKQGEITFPDDQSVSRVHAEVMVEHPAGNINEPMLTPVLTLTDVGSKFGTFATEENIQSKTNVNAREAVTLSIGEKLRFGLQWNEYRIDYTSLVLTSSSFKATTEFKEAIVKLGGHYVNEWNEYVTHVVMESLTLTIKAVCALLAAKPIVTPKYVTDLVSAFEKRKNPPSPDDYLPDVIEKGMVNLEKDYFHPNTARTTIFAGKTFLFSNPKHLKKLAVAIEAGGGTAKLITDALTENVLSSKVAIMGHPQNTVDGERDARIKTALDTYKRGGKRLIADSEIGLAAVYNSIEKHCNPNYSMSNVILPNIPTQTQGSSDGSAPIVPETQCVEPEDTGNGGISIDVINETVLDSQNEKVVRNSSLGPEARKGEKRSVVDSGNSASKKRSAAETLSKPETKRAKESSSSNTSRSQSRLAASRNNSHHKLNSLFNFSSSDEDDEEMAVIPESQPVATIGHRNGEAPNQSSQRPLVKVVDVRNLQSLTSTQESSVVGAVSDDEVFRVPASPEPEEPDSSVPLRRSGTDFVQTVTTSLMNAETIPVPSNAEKDSLNESTSSKRPTRKQPAIIKAIVSIDGEIAGPSRKRRRDEGDANSLATIAKKLNLDGPVVKKEEGAGDISGISFVKKPLINKNHSMDSFMLRNDPDRSSDRKNFKPFKKVLPKFIKLDISLSQENKSRNDTSEISVVSDSTREPNIKLKKISYYPGSTRYALLNASSASPTLNSHKTESPDFGRKFTETVNQRRDKRGEKVEPSRVQDQPLVASTSGRRVSPRKAVPAIKLPSPPPPVGIMDSDEDEDDMWSFNR